MSLQKHHLLQVQEQIDFDQETFKNRFSATLVLRINVELGLKDHWKCLPFLKFLMRLLLHLLIVGR